MSSVWYCSRCSEYQPDEGQAEPPLHCGEKTWRVGEDWAEAQRAWEHDDDDGLRASPACDNAHGIKT